MGKNKMSLQIFTITSWKMTNRIIHFKWDIKAMKKEAISSHKFDQTSGNIMICHWVSGTTRKVCNSLTCYRLTLGYDFYKFYKRNAESWNQLKLLFEKTYSSVHKTRIEVLARVTADFRKNSVIFPWRVLLFSGIWLVWCVARQSDMFYNR